MEMLAVSAAPMTNVVNQQVCYPLSSPVAFANEVAESVLNSHNLNVCWRRIVEEVEHLIGPQTQTMRNWRK
jgi:hypothetical protein